MAIRWEWNDKIGTATHEEGYTLNLYRGNAFIIAIYEQEEDGKRFYTLHWFAASKEHMKNMLGLNKGYDNCFSDFGVKELRLNTKYKETADFVQMLAKAKVEIKIELYKGESK